MWLHITAMGVLQTLAGLPLLLLNVVAFAEIVWFIHGMSRSDRTMGEWFRLLFLLSLAGLLDAAYVWWVRDHMRVLLGVLLALSHLGVLTAIAMLVTDRREYRTVGRWCGRILMVATVLVLDASYLGLVPPLA